MDVYLGQLAGSLSSSSSAVTTIPKNVSKHRSLKQFILPFISVPSTQTPRESKRKQKPGISQPEETPRKRKKNETKEKETKPRTTKQKNNEKNKKRLGSHFVFHFTRVSLGFPPVWAGVVDMCFIPADPATEREKTD